ncbi:MAG: class I SAM-dependent methyltransferase [Actinobacteria bacterium]|nr:class I SAM-dependent methyltransferase [Actinomycetota bacterium]MBU4441392.1 class I SAM-dependent methyltransferase [Actinomycetota bacterium]MCG2818306.1 class I SAM-dependent methyltransferase [Actinomycetes bacterium]
MKEAGRVNHERLADLLRCPACGEEMRYRPRVFSYCCEGKVLHTYRVKGEIADLVWGECDGRQKSVNRAFNRVAGRTYDKNLTGATAFDRLMIKAMWGTTKFIPLLFELLDSVASDCEPGYFLDIPVGTGVFTAGEYSLQPNLEFIAADHNRMMLESALEKVRAEDFGNVMLVRTDVTRLPFVDEAFSGVMTMNGIGSFPDKISALDEMVRVLKPGGKLAGSLYVMGERLLTDILVGRFAAMLGLFTKPFYNEEEFIGALDSRGIENSITRKVGPIMFFSGRKKALDP